jgi:hypothetical protein
MPWNWSSALTGGLAGSLLTIFTRWIGQLWLRPRIKLRFAESESGCAINTHFEGTEPQRYYIRIKVLNSGRSTAIGVSASITQLTLEAPGIGKTTVEEEVFHLRYSHRQRFAHLSLAPRAHQYLEVAHIKRSDSSLNFEFYPDLPRLRQRGFGSRGTYGAQIFATAENAKAAKRFIKWSWDGTFPGITISR